MSLKIKVHEKKLVENTMNIVANKETCMSIEASLELVKSKYKEDLDKLGD